MKLKTAATRDEVPEALRESAVEGKDGSWHYAEDEDTTGLKNTVKTVRKERDEAVAAQRAAEEKAAATQRELDAKVASTGDTDKKISELLTKWNADKDAAVAAAKKPLEDQLAAANTKLNDHLVVGKLREAFRSNDGDPDHENDVIDLTKANWRLVDDKPVLYGADGNPTTTSPEDFYKEHKAKKGLYYKGTQADGGGAAGVKGSGGTVVGNDKPVTEWSTDERRAFIDANGQEAYRTKLDEFQRDAFAKAGKKVA